MTRRAVMAFVMAALVVAGCSSGSGSGAAASGSSAPPTTHPSSTVATSSASTSASTSSASAGTDRCHTSQLAAAFVDTQGAAGSSIGTFSLTNTSSSPCTVFGFPGIALTDDAGNAVVPAPTRNQAVPPVTVTLAPGQHADFLMQWSNDVNGTGCFTVSKVVITPPDETDSVTIPAVDANGTKLSPCGTGATSVQVVRPA